MIDPDGSSEAETRVRDAVVYKSQNGSGHDQLNVRYHRLNNMVEAGKPKWQRWATFQRLEDRLKLADYLATKSLMYVVQRLTGKPFTGHQHLDWR
jgi:hypothetical protein